jgi:hypothetical protein
MRTLNYERQTQGSSSRIVPRLAHLTLLYPFLIAGGIVVEWLVAWAVLGHRPEPMVNDPKGIAGVQSIHFVVQSLLILGALPAFVTGAVVNVMYVIDRRLTAVMGCLRLILFWIAWPALLAFFRLRPSEMLDWWFD